MKSDASNLDEGWTLAECGVGLAILLIAAMLIGFFIGLSVAT